jgi:hypothetical protein
VESSRKYLTIERSCEQRWEAITQLSTSQGNGIECRMPKACAFCPETANITGEHLWSDWAGKLLGEQEYKFTRTEPDGKQFHWENTALHPKSQVVCGDCNNGWMSELETKTKSVAADIVVNGTPKILDDRSVAIIAAFGFLKGIVADHMHQGEPFYSVPQCHSFREALSIPDGVHIWLGSSPFAIGIFHGWTASTAPKSPRGFDMNIFTYALGHLIIQVVGCRWKRKSIQRHAKPPSIRQSVQWVKHSIPIWPTSRTPITWPPVAHLGNQGINAFIHRWSFLAWRVR